MYSRYLGAWRCESALHQLQICPFYSKSISIRIHRIIYASNFTANAKATLTKGEGDGTVNLRSLAACSKWEGEMSGRHHFEHRVFNNTEHLQILRDEAPARYVADLIAGLNLELRMSEPVISLAP